MTEQRVRPGPARPAQGPGGPGARGGNQDEDALIRRVNERLRPAGRAPGQQPGMAAVSADALVEAAEELGRYLAEDVKLNTTQIRRFLSQINRLNAELDERNFQRDRVVLLKPKLAYAAGKEKKVMPLAQVLVPAIDMVHNYEDYVHFARFVEAVVAYHRYYGGRNE